MADQQAELSFEVEIDFVVEDGVEVGRVAAAPGAAATAAYAADGNGGNGGNGGASMLGSAARWVWREVTALERASLGRLRRP